MKPVDVSVGAILLALALASGCASTEARFPPLWETLSLHDDAEFVVRTIRQNYPFLTKGTAKTAAWEEMITRRLREPITERDVTHPRLYLRQYLEGLNWHTGILDEDEYWAMLDSYRAVIQDSPGCRPWLDALQDPEVADTYGPRLWSTQQRRGPEEGFQYSLSRVAVSGLVFVYLKVPSFNFVPGTASSLELESLKEELLRATNSAAGVVVDIRGNGGGADYVWRNVVLPAIIRQPITWQGFTGFLGGPASMPFITSQLGEPAKFSASHLLNGGSSSAFKYISEEKVTVKPARSGGLPLKITLVIDKGVFSASEAFVRFCKDTRIANTVGQRTSGDGQGFAPILVKLPRSHLLLRLPICAGLTVDGEIVDETGTDPNEVVATETSADFAMKTMIAEFTEGK